MCQGCPFGTPELFPALINFWVLRENFQKPTLQNIIAK
jgi:hypothetical protein